MATTYAVRRSVLDATMVARLQRWAAEIARWPAGSHHWGHYAEETAGGPAICRTENVSACHPGVGALVDDRLRVVATETAGVAMTPFKDKVNYKQPGGAGFSPHQDLPAYPGVARVASVLVAIDDCTIESGCLRLSEGVHRVLPTDDGGVIRPDVVAGLTWMPVALAAGDAVCFDGLVPHYSEGNRSTRPRRVLVASYAPTSEGYDRARYYQVRKTRMAGASADDGRFRISTLADFQGIEVAVAPPGPEDRCTHQVAGPL